MQDNVHNSKADNAIRILMNNSIWGQHTDLDFLIGELQEEFDELLNGIRWRNRENSFEESADVLMLILCILNKMCPDENTYVSRIIDLMISKLHRRYYHIFSENRIGTDIFEENKIWEKAKKEESVRNLLYCPNKDCKHYRDIIGAKITQFFDKHKCLYCEESFVLGKNCILLGELTVNRKKCMLEIEYYLKSYCYGNNSAIQLFSDEAKDSFASFVKYVISDKNKMYAFKQYITVKYPIQESKISEFVQEVKRKSKSISNNTIESVSKFERLFDHYMETIRNNYKNLEINFTPSQLIRINKYAKSLRFTIVKKIEKILKFSAKSWNNESIAKYLLPYKDECIIECMLIIHFQRDEIRDYTIELSNMYACPVGCEFCASGALAGKPCELFALDYLKQINTCIHDNGINPSELSKFYISFAGIGEPSLQYKEVSFGMTLIEQLFPNVQFNIATMALDISCFEFWNRNNHKIRTIQIPCYATSLNKLKVMTKNIPGGYELASAVKSAINYKLKHSICRIKLNYIVICGYNDTDKYVDELCTYLSDFKNDIEIKVSYLNETRPSVEKGLKSPSIERMHEIEDKISKYGYSCYVFGTKENSELGCGQLSQNHTGGEKFDKI